MENTGHSRLSALALAFLALIWVSPFSWLFLNAFNPASTGRLTLPEAIGFDNFALALSGNAGRQFLNSLLIAAGTATLSVIVGVAAAYPLSRLKIPGRNALLWTLVLLRMLPSAGILVPLYFAAQRTGLLNQLGVIIALTVLNLPFTLLLLKNFFDTVPIELEEAAYVEGASLFQIVTRIVLPMSSAGIAVVWFFSFTGAWNEFLLPLVMITDENKRTAPLGLAFFQSEHTTQYSLLAAASIIVALPVVALYVLLQRHFISGMLSGAVKA